VDAKVVEVSYVEKLANLEFREGEMDRANIESMGVHFKNGPFEGQQWEA